MSKTTAQKNAARRRKSTLSASSLNRSRSKAREGRGQAGKLKRKLEPIPVTGDGSAPELLPAVPESGDFAALIAATPRELRQGDAKASARYASERLLPHLLVLQHGPTMASYVLAAAVYHVVGLLQHLRRDPQRAKAVRRALRFGKGKTPYLQLLNGLAPPPEEDGSGARKAAQNRHSNMNCALMAAEREGLHSRQLLQRLIADGGFENLIEQARAEGRGDEDEGDEDGDRKRSPSVKRSKRRQQTRQAEQGQREENPLKEAGVQPATPSDYEGGAVSPGTSQPAMYDEDDANSSADFRAPARLHTKLGEADGDYPCGCGSSPERGCLTSG